MLQVYTAFASYKADPYLNITRLAATLDGLPFAPSWALLNPFLEKRKGEGLTPEDWVDYSRRYIEEMRFSFWRYSAAWSTLLTQDEVTLTCFCKLPDQCHRTLLARDILPKICAVYRGERQMVEEITAEPKQRSLF